MTKGVIAGVILAVVASAVTAGVVVVGQGGGGSSEVKIPPTEALEPWEITKIPPGTPVADLTLPIDYGRFRIVPAGNSPVPLPVPTAPPGVSSVGRDIRESDTLDEFRDHDLFFDPPYIPDGWELTEAGGEAVLWDDDSRSETVFGLEYQRPGYFYIRIVRFQIAPEGKVQFVGHTPQSQHARTLGQVRGVPVVFQHQAPGEQFQALLQVHFVIDDVLTFIESVAIDFDELIQIADALIAQAQEG